MKNIIYSLVKNDPWCKWWPICGLCDKLIVTAAVSSTDPSSTQISDLVSDTIMLMINEVDDTICNKLDG